jgi:type I restriction enzyme S subunit
MSSVYEEAIGPHVNVLNGYAFSSEHFNPDKGIPLVRIRDLKTHGPDTRFAGDYEKKYVVGDGDILVGMDGDFNAVRWRGGKALLNQRVCKITVQSSELNESYLFHWLQPKLDEIHRRTPQTTVKHLAAKDVRKIRLPFFPIEEQRHIADVLDTVDAAIQETDAVVEKQEQVKTGLLQDLLTRGLDADGRLRDPEREPGAFRETELGSLPREWQVQPLERLLTRFRNGSSAKQIREPTPYPVARIETISSGKIDHSSVRYHREEQPEFLMQSGDILYSHINSTAHIGKVAIYKGAKPLYHGMNLLILRPDQQLIRPRLLYEILASGRGRAYARREARPAVNQESLTQGAVGAFPVQVPPHEEQQRLLERMDSERQYVDQERQYRDKLRSLKTGLMQDLLTGRIRVPEAQERVDEVTA